MFKKSVEMDKFCEMEALLPFVFYCYKNGVFNCLVSLKLEEVIGSKNNKCKFCF